MELNTLKVGQKVLFGRSNGEKTLGEIVKINPSRAKIKQLESRGSFKDHPLGMVWTVPPQFIYPMDPTVQATAPATSAIRTFPVPSYCQLPRELSSRYLPCIDPHTNRVAVWDSHKAVVIPGKDGQDYGAILHDILPK